MKRLNDIYERNLHNDGVEYIHGRAHLLNQREVQIDLDDGGKDYIRAKKILIATGGHPNLPKDIPGFEYGITSDGFFELETQPKKVAIVGAGYIAVEFAGMFNALGTETHLFIRHDTFLRNFDPMIQDTITKEYEHLGIKIYKGSKASRVEKEDPSSSSSSSSNTSLKLHYTSSNRGNGVLENIDTLVWAIGRSAEVEDLGLDQAGVAQKPEKGLIQANEYQETNVPNIYALGDVCGLIELTPVAIAAGRKLSDRLFGPPVHAQAKLDYTNIPSVVFAHPEVGSIGLTEPQAREKFGDENVKIYKTAFVGMYYALMPPEEKKPSAYKLIVAGKDETVVGLHIVGQGCSEILQGFGVAVKMGAKKKDFDSCVAIHPTSAEELVTLK